MLSHSDLPGTVLTIGIICLGAWLLDLHHALDGERYFYPAVCEMSAARTCAPKPATEVGYKASDNGQVVLWSSMVLLQRLENCTVRDARNFVCPNLEVRDGEPANGAQFLSSFTSRSDAYPLMFVSKWRWVAAKLGIQSIDKPSSWP